MTRQKVQVLVIMANERQARSTITQSRPENAGEASFQSQHRSREIYQIQFKVTLT
jgi:hypothetical protein